MAILEVKDINCSYGNVQVLWDVNLKIDEAKIVALLGANGAGKTTLLNTLTGMMQPTSGEVLFMGERIDGIQTSEIIKKGVAYLPEGGRLFPDMTIKENLELGAYPSQLWKDRKKNLEKVYEMFPILGQRRKQLARTMSGGERQMLAMGRCLMSNPKICFFDELSYGLSPLMAQEVFKIVKKMHEAGITVFIVEQNVHQTLEVADYAYVIENGKIVLSGEGQSMLEDDYIKKAYLGI